jgi:hypothetical protein
MAIVQCGTFTRQLDGDGTATTVTFDLTADIQKLGWVPGSPTTIVGFNNGGLPTVTSSSLEGNEVTVTFTTAPSHNANGGSGLLTIYLGF